MVSNQSPLLMTSSSVGNTRTSAMHVCNSKNTNNYNEALSTTETHADRQTDRQTDMDACTHSDNNTHMLSKYSKFMQQHE